MRYHSRWGEWRQTEQYGGLYVLAFCVLAGCAKPAQGPPTAVVPVIGLPPITIDLKRPGLDVQSLPSAEAVAGMEHTVRLDPQVAETMIERRPVRLGYPAEAAQRHLSGYVRFRVIIAPDGTVQGLTLLETTSNFFVPGASASVQSWQYRPYLINGQPVAVDTQVRLEFTPR